MTEEPLVDTEVKTLLPCLMSMMVAPLGPVVPDLVVASAFEKVTVPKLAKGTRPPPDEKSSTIHSASNSQSDGCPENECETDFPVDLFVTVAVPPVLEDAVTVTVTVSPALKLIPEKSWA